MAALDLLGRRWALRVLWELRDGPLGFRALQAACDGMSSSVLRDRLHELTEAVLVERRDDAYQLTTLGADLGDSLAPLTRWAERWSEQLRSARGPLRRRRPRRRQPREPHRRRAGSPLEPYRVAPVGQDHDELVQVVTHGVEGGTQVLVGAVLDAVVELEAGQRSAGRRR